MIYAARRHCLHSLNIPELAAVSSRIAAAIAMQTTIFSCRAQRRRQFEIYCFKWPFDWHFTGHVVVRLLSFTLYVYSAVP